MTPCRHVHTLVAVAIGGDTFGERLRYALRARDMTAAELAAAIGVRPSRLSEWANDQGFPASGMPTAIADTLAVSRRWLTVGHGDPFESDDARSEIRELGQRVDALVTLLQGRLAEDGPSAKAGTARQLADQDPSTTFSQEVAEAVEDGVDAEPRKPGRSGRAS